LNACASRLCSGLLLVQEREQLVVSYNSYLLITTVAATHLAGSGAHS
jgi:hypothetical protein